MKNENTVFNMFMGCTVMFLALVALSENYEKNNVRVISLFGLGFSLSGAVLESKRLHG